MRVEVDHPQEFGFPRERHGRRPPWRCAGRQGRNPAPQKALEYALDGIAAAEDNRGNVGYRAPLMGKQDNLRAESELGIGRCIVQLAEFGHLGSRQRW
jgi:hypothetical protein